MIDGRGAGGRERTGGEEKRRIGEEEGGESRGEINRGIRVTNGENEKGENEGEGKKEGRKKGGWKVEETLMRRNVV